MGNGGKVKQYIRAMSPRAEFTVVILVAFGYFMLGSVLSVFAPSAEPPISEAGLRFLVAYEVVVFVALGTFLALRGWRLQKLGFTPTWRDTGIGVGLALIAYLAFAALWLVLRSYVPGLDDGAHSLVTPGLGVMTVFAVVALNPVFEEVFVCG